MDAQGKASRGPVRLSKPAPAADGPRSARLWTGTRPPNEATHRGPTDLERLVFFSDAVFAIAITLLVLPLADADLTDSDLPGQLLRLRPHLLSSGLSFLVIGTYWVAHQRAFRQIVQLDATLLGLNLAFLACIGLLPFPTAVLGAHGNTTAGVVYAATMSVTGFLSAAMWAYASHHNPSRPPGP